MSRLNVKKAIPKFAFDRLFFRRLWTLLGLLLPTLRSTSFLITACCIGVGVLQQVIAYYVGILPSEFFVVMGKRDWDAFQMLAVKSVLIIVAKSFSIAAGLYLMNVLYLNWRQSLGYCMHQLYFRRMTFYKLSNSEHIDNPDQRMTQDIDKLVKTLATKIVTPFVLSPFIIGYYTYKTYASSGYLGPLTIYSYFVVGTVVNKFLLSPVVNLVVKQERKEGNFRVKHVSVRTNAEAIAFYHSGRLENTMTNNELDSLIATQQKLVNWQFPLNLSTQTFDYFGGILSYFIIAIPIFMLDRYEDMGAADISGIISRNSFFYIYLIYSFSTVIDLSSQMAEVAGTTHRVIELYEELQKEHLDCLRIDGSRPPSELQSNHDEEGEGNGKNDDQLISVKSEMPGGLGVVTPGIDNRAHEDMANRGGYGSLIEERIARGFTLTDRDVCGSGAHDDGAAFSLDHVSYGTPDSTVTMLSELSMEIVRGRNVLISGESGAGKTSFFRVLAGLWQATQGRLTVHWRVGAYGKMMFLPQKCYAPNCSQTLRQQIVYPKPVALSVKNDDSSRLESILASLHIDSLLQRCNGLDTPVEFDWMETLSPGEMQRLSLARVFYHRPAIVFLDETTSNLGFDMETNVYELLQKNHITYISIGHRLSLRRHHDIELHVNGRGGWTIGDVDNSTQNGSQMSIDHHTITSAQAMDIQHHRNQSSVSSSTAASNTTATHGPLPPLPPSANTSDKSDPIV